MPVSGVRILPMVTVKTAVVSAFGLVREKCHLAPQEASQTPSRAVVNAVGPPSRCLFSSMVQEDSQRPTRRRQTGEGAVVQYHCTAL
jgi:hypothetical protein